MQRDALSEFLDWLEEKDDVFFVTGTQVGKLLTKTFEAITQYNIGHTVSLQALLWMTDPKPLSQIKLVKSHHHVSNALDSLKSNEYH